jgi:hexokinase
MARFRLTADQLESIARAFREKTEEGLAKDGGEIKGLITYLRIRAPEEGRRALVVDLGGTQVRAAVVAFGRRGPTIEKGPATALLPIRRGVPLPKERFLESLVAQVRKLGVSQPLPLGYCFSYPAVSLPDGDATLIRWTKEVVVPDTEGERVGAMLFEALSGAGIRCTSVAVLNDTVAAVLSGLAGRDADGAVGLIVGTGTNMAPLLHVGRIPKFPATLAWDGPVAVNLESGNFHPPGLDEADDELDRRSENPGTQRFEKAVSGAYLGRLLALARPDLALAPEAGSREVVQLAGRGLCPEAQALLDRSAGLVASTLAGLVSLMRDGGSREVSVVAEGGLFWGAPGYRETVQRTVARLLPRLGCGATVEIRQVENANLIGTAVAALR